MARCAEPGLLFSTARSGTAQVEAELVGTGVGAPVAIAKATFPADEVEQTGAVIRILLGAPAPLDTQSVAAAFRNGGRSRPKVQSILYALARQGVASTMDGGATFSMRRAA